MGGAAAPGDRWRCVGCVSVARARAGRWRTARPGLARGRAGAAGRAAAGRRRGAPVRPPGRRRGRRAAAVAWRRVWLRVGWEEERDALRGLCEMDGDGVDGDMEKIDNGDYAILGIEMGRQGAREEARWWAACCWRFQNRPRRRWGGAVKGY